MRKINRKLRTITNIIIKLLLILLISISCSLFAPGNTTDLFAKRMQTIPLPGQLNQYILTVLQSYPLDGSYQYYWPAHSDWEGTPHTLMYEGEIITRGDPYRRSYCSGLMFEVFFRAYREYCRRLDIPFQIGKLDAEELQHFRRVWYGVMGAASTMQSALIGTGLGEAVTNWQEVRPGDFLQFWRNNGKGHAVVFMGWWYGPIGIRGICYWSTQPTTNGIGYHYEEFGGSEGIDPHRLYFARVGSHIDD